MKYTTTEFFRERINQKVLHNLILYKADEAIEKCNIMIIEDNKKLLKLLGDLLLMGLLPFELELKKIPIKKKISNKMYFQEKENIVFKRFISNKLPNNIKYKSSILYDLSKEFGFDLPFWVIRDICLKKPNQKKLFNRYIHLDKYR